MLRKFERPLVLTGTVDGGRVDEDAVAAIADGRIVAVSPVVFRNIGGAAFALMLPLDGSAGLSEVRLALVRGSELLDGGLIVDSPWAALRAVRCVGVGSGHDLRGTSTLGNRHVSTVVPRRPGRRAGGRRVLRRRR